jgi:hypothetical protein
MLGMLEILGMLRMLEMLMSRHPSTVPAQHLTLHDVIPFSRLPAVSSSTSCQKPLYSPLRGFKYSTVESLDVVAKLPRVVGLFEALRVCVEGSALPGCNFVYRRRAGSGEEFEFFTLVRKRVRDFYGFQTRVEDPDFYGVLVHCLGEWLGLRVHELTRTAQEFVHVTTTSDACDH